MLNFRKIKDRIINSSIYRKFGKTRYTLLNKVEDNAKLFAGLKEKKYKE